MFECVSFFAGIACTEQKLAPLAEEGEADTVSGELCSKLRLQCWWLKGSVSLSSAVCFSVGCFVSGLGFFFFM